MSIKKHLKFLELLYKKKEKIPIDFLNDEIYVDSYFFTIFWTSMLSKIEFSDLGKLTQSKRFFLCHILRIKDSILTAELHLTRKEIFFILENLKLMKKSYDFISETLFIPYPIPEFLKFSQQSSLSFFSLKIFEVQNPA